jgi:hypothetical protein
MGDNSEKRSSTLSDMPKGVEASDFYLFDNIQASSGAHGVLWAVSPELKQQGCETDHSPPSSSEVNSGATLSLPHTSSWHGA